MTLQKKPEEKARNAKGDGEEDLSVMTDSHVGLVWVGEGRIKQVQNSNDKKDPCFLSD